MLISTLAPGSVSFLTTAVHIPPGLPPAAKCQRHAVSPDDARHAALSLVPSVQLAAGAMLIAIATGGMLIAIATADRAGAVILTSYASPVGAAIVNVLVAGPVGRRSVAPRNNVVLGVAGAGPRVGG
jgi:hypothetical protein